MKKIRLALIPLDCLQTCWDIILNEVPANLNEHSKKINQ